MRILILSDTHGNYPLAIRALGKAGQVDRIIHLGDDFEDARLIEEFIGQPIIKVPGNCDPGVGDAREITGTFDGITIFITHGDRYQVKSGLANLRRKVAAEKVQVVLYGHTHVAAIETIGGILFINPGCLGYNCRNASCAILTIADSGISAEIISVDPVNPVNGE